MATMKMTRTLRSNSGSLLDAIAPGGAKVAILGTQDVAEAGSWTHIRLIAAISTPDGWVSSDAIDGDGASACCTNRQGDVRKGVLATIALYWDQCSLPYGYCRAQVAHTHGVRTKAKQRLSISLPMIGLLLSKTEVSVGLHLPARY
ncbi:hypothetical protein ACU4GH_28985 [Bradyrhizobium betae]